MIKLLLQRFFIVFLFSFANIALSQNPTPNQEFRPQEVTFPKSPEVKGLFDFSPYSVDHSSGSANIDIPLYSIESGRIKVPISVSYHTGGIRVQDIASMIGLGWNLNFGYCVQVHEEETKIYPYSTKLYKTELAALGATSRGVSWVKEMVNSADGYYRSMHTIYDFNCGTFSGTFYYDDNNQLQLLSADDNVKIEAINYAESASVMSGFKITTPEGIEYIFDKRETTWSQEQSYPGTTPQTNAFWVSKITDLISGDIVQFTYNEKDPYYSYQNESYSRIFQANDGASWGFPGETIRSIPFKVQSLQIASIGFTGGYINFASSKDRLDIDKTRITGMSIYSNGIPNTEVNTIKFNQSYFGSGDKYNRRLRLDSVTFSGTQNSLANNYRFEYDPTSLPPYRQTDNSREHNSYSVDYWGFYNGYTGGDGLISKKILQDFFVSKGWNKSLQFTTDRSANPSFTKACVLNKVIYPTGGYAQFDYENHQLPLYYLGSTLGGLRVKSIRYFTDQNDSKPIEKTFKYLTVKELTPASSELFRYRKDKSYVDQGPYYGYCADIYCFTAYQMEYISSEPLNAFVYHHGSPVFYEKVEEYNGNLTKNEGKTVYTFKFRETIHNDYSVSSIKEIGDKLVHTNDWTRGQLLSKEVYKKNNELSDPYILTSKEINTYKEYSKGWAHLGLMISKNDRASGSVGNIWPNYSWDLVGPDADNYYIDMANSGLVPVDAFVYNDISVFKNYSRLSKQETYNYVGNDNIYTATDYFYESPYHEQLTKKETYGSNKDINSTKYYYPKDLVSEPLMSSLVAQNRVSSPIKTEEYVNGSKTSEEKTIYKQEAATANLLLPKWEYAAKFPNSLPSLANIGQLEQKMTYDLYDINGKVLQYTPEGGVPTVIIWGYRNTLPIAKIENTTYSSITSTLISEAQTASLGNNENTLITKLNSLRSALPNAMVTTYTYIPLVGVSSITDSKGYSTYYTYDSSNRLQYIKDHNLNVLQRYCYNYLGQIMNCPDGSIAGITYTNAAKSATFTKTSCASGLTGSSHLYSVPAGIYSSTVSQADADAKANNEITVNGQNFANATGICGTIPSVPAGLTFTSATSTSINFSWTAVTGASSYKIYKNGVYVSTVTAATGSLAGLTASTSYSIQILASNLIGDGTLCTAVSMTTTAAGPAAPAGLIFNSATATSLNFSWSSVSGATAYKIYRNGTYVSTVTSTAGVLSGLTISTIYNIQVLSSNASADGPLSAVVPMSTLPSPPTGLTFVNCTASVLNFSWTAVAGATGYKIYKNGIYVSTTSATTGSLSGLTAATAYNIQVSAINVSGEGALCSSVSMSTAPILTAPTGLTLVSFTGSTINFAWQPVAGATGYKLYKNGVFISSVTTTSGGFSGLAGATSYSVQVSATYGSLEGPLCNPTYMSTPSVNLGTPAWVTGINTTASTLKFAWEAVAGATGYRIYKNGIFTTTASTNFIELSGLTASTTYSIQISATNDSLEGALCSPRSMTTAAASLAPTGLTLTSATATSIQFSWSGVTGASGYRIYKNGFFESAVTTTSGYFLSLVPSTSYNIQVSAYNADGDSALSSPVSMKTAAGSMGFYKSSGIYPVIAGSSSTYGSIVNNLTSPIYVYAIAQGSSGTGNVSLNGVTVTVSGGQNLRSSNYALIAGGAVVPATLSYSGGGSLILAYSLAPGAPLTYWSSPNQ
jgi:hypothetical protein